jgi:CRISPR-associated protein Cas2
MPSTCIIAYDVADNRRRNAVLRLLRRWRIDGQLSVHECRFSRQAAAELFMQMASMLDPEQDRLLLAWTDLRQRRGKNEQERYSKLKLIR